MKSFFLTFPQAAIIAVFFIADRIAKMVAVQDLAKVETSRSLWAPHQNSTIAFFWQQSDAVIFLVTLCALLVAVLMGLALKIQHGNFGPIFFLSGAISNVADRMVYGGVIDYFNVGFGGRVNIADAMIIGGIFWTIVFYEQNKNIHATH